MQPNKKHMTYAAGAVAIIAAVIFWPSSSKEQPKPSKKNYSTVNVQMQHVPDYYKAVGTIKPTVQSNLAAQITAKIEKVLVTPGEKVKAGQTLILLDNRNAKAVVQQAEQSVAAADAMFKERNLNFQRMQKLIKVGYVTAAQFDQSQAAYLQSKANLLQAHKALQAANIALSYCTITAPSDGVILNKTVNPGDQAAPGLTLLQFQAKNALRLVANVPESLVNQVHIGQRLPVSVDAADEQLIGRVSEIVPNIDPQTRSFVVKVTIPASLSILPGMFGRLWIDTGSREVLTLNSNLITTRGQLHFVNVLTKHGPQLSLVTLGSALSDHRIIVLSGLNANDKVIG